MPKTNRFLPLFAGVVGAVIAALPLAASAQVHIESNSILRFFEQQKAGQDDKTGIPGYEYLQIDAGKLDEDGFSFHGYGWGRYDFGDYFKDDTAGEVLYGYLQYRHAEGNQFVRLGRQEIFEGGGNQILDGLRLGSNVTSYFSFSAYGGKPVPLEVVDGSTGDRIWGGRIANHWGGYYEVGLSFNRLDNDGDKQDETVAIDSSLTPPGPVALRGLSKRSLVDDSWAEHSYEAMVTLGNFSFRPFYERFDYGSFFNTGVNTGGPFRFLENSTEVVTDVGTDGSWRATDTLELVAKLKHYHYQERGENAWYYAGSGVLHHGDALTQIGGELGRMQGESNDNRYTLARGYFYWDHDPEFVSGDIVYAHYDEDVQGKSNSTVATLSAGKGFLSKKLTLKLSGSYSSDPYFNRDFRGQVAAEYVFDSK